MRVVILCMKDYAGSGLKIRNAVGLANPSINIKAFSFKKGIGNTKAGILASEVISDKKSVQKIVNKSDIIHFKGDWSYQGNFHGISIPPRKIVYTVSGSVFRRREGKYPKSVAQEKYPLSMYKGDLITALTPELLYMSDMVFTPHAWSDFNYKFKQGGKFIISHIPSESGRKGSDVILKGLSLLKRKDVKIIYKTGISHRESLAMKAVSHVYIDQFLLPSYGVAAIEAMSIGVPVMNWDEGLYPFSTPVIKAKERTPEAIAESLGYWLDWGRLKKLSEETYDYCKSVHGTMGEKWVKIYENL